MVTAVGCAGHARSYGEVQVREGASARSMQPGVVAARSASGVAVIATDIGRGMGFVIDPDGYVLTNRHVVEDADHIVQVSFPATDRTFSSVRILYIDPLRDLALLKIETDEPLDALPLATRQVEDTHRYLAQKDRVVLLERIDARGLPNDRSRFIARTGLVSTLGERNAVAGPGEFVGLTTDVERGQSGGPVLDRYGRAVGVVTWAWRDRHGGYAIPIAEATRMLLERPRLDSSNDIHERAVDRVHEFLRAVAEERFEHARRLTSPSYSKEVRKRAVVRILAGHEGNEAAVLRGFAGALEAMAAERGLDGDDSDAFRLLQDIVWRTGSDEFRAALALDRSLPREQLFSFFYEFGQAYVAARYFGDRSPDQAVREGVERLQTVDAARTFALAELVTSLGELRPTLEEVQVNPGAYAPSAVALLRTDQPSTVIDPGESMSRATVQRDVGRQAVRMSLRFEWGDWYIADVAATSLK